MDSAQVVFLEGAERCDLGGCGDRRSDLVLVGLVGRPPTPLSERAPWVAVPGPVLAPPRAFVAGHEMLRRLEWGRSTAELAEKATAFFEDVAALATEARSRRSRPRSDLARRAREALTAGDLAPVSLDGLTSELWCSRSHLCRTFKEVYGLTMTRYLHRLRIVEAMRRISDGEADELSRLALELGFTSHSHFSSIFRREVGMTPSAFRRRMARPPRDGSSGGVGS